MCEKVLPEIIARRSSYVKREAPDLTKPETLAGFDMIVCRNVLIYFQRQLQKKVIKNFHRVLKENGILWLGNAESLSGEEQKLFEPICKAEKIFRKREYSQI